MTTLPRLGSYVKAVARRGLTSARLAVVTVAVLALVYGPRRLFVRYVERVRRDGRSIAVDRLPGARTLRPGEMRRNGPPLPARPEIPRHPFKLRTMRPDRYPAPDLHLRYEEPPLSGLTLAGVGESRPRRTTKFFHAGYGHPYGAMERAFHLVAGREAVREVQRARWENRRALGPVAPRQRPVHDPAAMAAELKAMALGLGASSVGCTEVTEEALYAGVENDLPRAVVVAAPMDRERMLRAPSADTNVAVIGGYLDVGRAALALAAHIRSLGWRAEADTNLGGAPSKVLHVPLAVSAGLGQMGRHTSLITPEHGANVRLAAVLTDLPLALDEPVDVGIDEFCASCRVCSSNCPPSAIFETKQTVRGVEKWHLDFDRCMPYFTEHEGCGVCITVCPWSETGKAPLMTLLQQQRRAVRQSWPDPLPASERRVELADPQPDAAAGARADAAGVAVDDPEGWWRPVRVDERTEHPGHVVELALTAREGAELPAWAPGAHIELRLPSGRVRAYSLANPPTDRSRWRLGVKVEERGTGGSREVATLREGDRLLASRPGNNYPLRERHERYLLCAGGIGVTPMVGIAHRLQELGKPVTIHYSVTSEAQAVFADELRELATGNLHLHTDRTWLRTAFAGLTGDCAVYACGPSTYMDAVRDAAVRHGVAAEHVYTEDFGSDREDTPFDVVLASSGRRLRVEPGQTIAGELTRRGVHIPVSCGYGICGTCTVGVLDGEVDARDQILGDDERETAITLCCSRATSDELVIDL